MQGLDERNAVIDRCSFQLVNSLMQFFEYAVQMRLVFPVDFYIQANPERIAGKRTAENSGILCSGTYGVVLGEGILFPKACGAADGFHKFIFWGGKHVRSKRVSIQEF